MRGARSRPPLERARRRTGRPEPPHGGRPTDPCSTRRLCVSSTAKTSAQGFSSGRPPSLGLPPCGVAARRRCVHGIGGRRLTVERCRSRGRWHGRPIRAEPGAAGWTLLQHVRWASPATKIQRRGRGPPDGPGRPRPRRPPPPDTVAARVLLQILRPGLRNRGRRSALGGAQASCGGRCFSRTTRG